jgi:hypothetical protein
MDALSIGIDVSKDQLDVALRRLDDLVLGIQT